MLTFFAEHLFANGAGCRLVNLDVQVNLGIEIVTPLL